MQRFREIRASVHAGCAATWDDLPHYKKVDLMAEYEAGWRIEAIMAWESARERERNRGRST
jgi:hypothetical protein